jgi:ferredoxin-NADP reductase
MIGDVISFDMWRAFMSTSIAKPIAASTNALSIQVIRREVIAQDVVTLSFARPGTNVAPSHYLPGQFVTLMLPGRYEVLYRSYSLCGRGDPREPWEITVKKVQQGVVSNYLFDMIQVGMVLQATPPRGSFVLPTHIRPEMRFIFVAAGSGITPIRGMIRALAALPPTQRPQAQLHYASRTQDDIIYRSEWKQIDPQQTWLKQWHYITSTGMQMTPAAIFANSKDASRNTHWYMCGPDELRRDLQAALQQRNVAPQLIHTEVFADQSRRRPLISAASPVVARVAIQETGATINARSQETLLEALERHGYRPDFSCRTGTCGTCKLRVLGGRVHSTVRLSNTLSSSEIAAGYTLSCVAHPQGDVLIQSGGRLPARGHVPGISAATERAATRQAMRVGVMLAIGTLLIGIWTQTGHSPANAFTPIIQSTPGGTNNFSPGNDDSPPPGNNQPTNVTQPTYIVPPIPTVKTKSS